jgi:nitrogen fixation NifU-like protein
MYSEQVLDHFQHPRNSGEVAGADAVVEVQNPGCGDLLRLSAKVEDGKLTEVRFKTRGCVASIACSSVLTELISGQPIEVALRLQREDLLAKLGSLPPESMHATHLAMDALSALLKKL